MTKKLSSARLVWRTEKRKVSDLVSNPRNPRTITDKQKKELETSLRKFNLAEIPAVDADGKIVAGNMRIAALRQLGRGDELIDVRVPSRKLTEKEYDEYALRSNRNVGEWDWKRLTGYGEDLLRSSGFTEDDLDIAFGLDYAEDFDAGAERKKLLKGAELRTKVGQVWRLGDHKLAVGDATDRKVWQRLMGKEKFDFMQVDPPYRLAYNAKRARIVRTKDGRKLKREREYDVVGSTDRTGAFRFGVKGNRSYEGVEMKRGVPEYGEWLGIAKDYGNPTASNVMVFENWKNIRGLWDAIEKYWKVKNMVVWHTPNRHQGYMRPDTFYSKYDIALYGERGKVAENDVPEEEFEAYFLEKGRKMIESYEVALYGRAGSRTDIDKDSKKQKWGKVTDHVTANVSSMAENGQNIVFGAKPIVVLAPYMKALSPRGGIVVDPFVGSGSTIICAEILKRQCRAIELGPLNAEVALRRWEKFTGRKAERIAGPRASS